MVVARRLKRRVTSSFIAQLKELLCWLAWVRLVWFRLVRLFWLERFKAKDGKLHVFVRNAACGGGVEVTDGGDVVFAR